MTAHGDTGGARRADRERPRTAAVRRLATALLLLAACAGARAQAEFVRECPQRSFPDGVPAGNYSGITRLEGDRYAVVSDKSAHDGFFTFRIGVDPASGEITSVASEGFHGDGPGGSDCEGICLRPGSATVFIGREGDNSIAEYDMEGRATGNALEVPAEYGGAVPNYGLESLAYDEAGHLFWTANESTLMADGECATPANGARNVIRIQSFGDDMLPRKQYAYMMDAPAATSRASVYAMGVSEVAALGNGSLLVLEREFFVPEGILGAFCQCRIYCVTPDDAFAIDPGARITERTMFIPKRLVHSFRTSLTLLDHSIANYEGMCLGPVLDDGSRALILVSDSQDQYAGVLRDWFKTIVIRTD